VKTNPEHDRINLNIPEQEGEEGKKVQVNLTYNPSKQEDNSEKQAPPVESEEFPPNSNAGIGPAKPKIDFDEPEDSLS
jgi:hypothetical protein